MGMLIAASTLTVAGSIEHAMLAIALNIPLASILFASVLTVRGLFGTGA